MQTRDVLPFDEVVDIIICICNLLKDLCLQDRVGRTQDFPLAALVMHWTHVFARVCEKGLVFIVNGCERERRQKRWVASYGGRGVFEDSCKEKEEVQEKKRDGEIVCLGVGRQGSEHLVLGG